MSAAGTARAEFRYFLQRDVDLPVKVKINSLKGKDAVDVLEQLADSRYSLTTHSREAEMHVTCAICSCGHPLCSPVSTSYKCFPDPSQVRWDEWLTFPIKYSDLPIDACLCFTVWEVRFQESSPAGDKAAAGVDASLPPEPRTVPVGGTTLPMFNKKRTVKLGHRKLFLWPRVEADSSPHCSTPYKAWKARGLDKLDKIIRQYNQRNMPGANWLDNLTMRRIERLQSQAFEVDELTMGIADSHLVKRQWRASAYRDVVPAVNGVEIDPYDPSHMFLTIECPEFMYPIVFFESRCRDREFPRISVEDADALFVLNDPEIQRNPMEDKYYKLSRVSRGLADRDLKPQILERKRIAAIVASPNRLLTAKERQLLWTFRYSLTENKKALTKFLRAVDWSDPGEVEEALKLLKEWVPVDIADALELLSASFAHPEVRRYGVAQLQRADDDELQNYLLQLVQALRYEAEYPSDLSKFLIGRCTGRLELCNFFHWFLTVETDDKSFGEKFRAVHNDFVARLLTTDQGKEWHAALKAQGNLIQELATLSQACKDAKGRASAKEERIKSYLTTEMKHLLRFEKAICMPLRPDTMVHGIIADECRVYASAKLPVKIAFHAEGRNYTVIFKNGDDLRQDQLVIQMINLMDSLLKKVKLDLRLTPYRVLATSSLDGFVEFVPDSYTIQDILASHDKDIRKFFTQHNPKPQQWQNVLETFVKSCAGYCVITYILGIGDRHLENVLLTTDGHLFHIDFGFIFGRDPKPFPPPMKFSKEMVDAMGGPESSHYSDFRKYCCLAFNILRGHAGLVLNLLRLMGDANIPDLSIDVDKNLLKVQEKFRLDLDDEAAERYLLSLIDESVSALFPQLMERIHKWALYWRK